MLGIKHGMGLTYSDLHTLKGKTLENSESRERTLTGYSRGHRGCACSHGPDKQRLETDATVYTLPSLPQAEGRSDEKRLFQVEESVCAKA